MSFLSSAGLPPSIPLTFHLEFSKSMNNTQRSKKLKPLRKVHKFIKKSLGGLKRNYMKFNHSKLNELNTIYSKNHYPSKDEMQNIAFSFEEKLGKIENWFKHKRRKEFKIGLLKFEKKKVFTKNENRSLMQEFLQNRNPSSQKYKEIACFHSCQIKHIKNWFSYKRKILLRISRNPSKIENKPKQEQILEKLLNETTLKIENSEERSDVITKIEYQEEIIKPLVKKEEEENQKQVVKQENCMKYKEENAFIKQKSAYIDCLALQAQMQRAYQGFWLGQMNQNYIQNYNSWVNYQSMMLQRK